jgi:hypothetical protein
MDLQTWTDKQVLKPDMAAYSLILRNHDWTYDGSR